MTVIHTFVSRIVYIKIGHTIHDTSRVIGAPGTTIFSWLLTTRAAPFFSVLPTNTAA